MTTTGKTARPPMEQKLADAIAHAEALLANAACVNMTLQKQLTKAIADWQKLRANLGEQK